MTSISAVPGIPGSDMSGETGALPMPSIVSSSATTIVPSRNATRCGRKNSSAARATNGSSQPSRMLRRMTWTS